MIVLDASALVDVMLDQSTKAWVLDRLRGQPVVAPAHQPAEVLSALSRLVRAGEIPADTAREALLEVRRWTRSSSRRPRSTWRGHLSS